MQDEEVEMDSEAGRNSESSAHAGLRTGNQLDQFEDIEQTAENMAALPNLCSVYCKQIQPGTIAKYLTSGRLESEACAGFYKNDSLFGYFIEVLDGHVSITLKGDFYNFHDGQFLKDVTTNVALKIQFSQILSTNLNRIMADVHNRPCVTDLEIVKCSTNMISQAWPVNDTLQSLTLTGACVNHDCGMDSLMRLLLSCRRLHTFKLTHTFLFDVPTNVRWFDSLYYRPPLRHISLVHCQCKPVVMVSFLVAAVDTVRAGVIELADMFANMDTEVVKAFLHVLPHLSPDTFLDLGRMSAGDSALFYAQNLPAALAKCTKVHVRLPYMDEWRSHFNDLTASIVDTICRARLAGFIQIAVSPSRYRAIRSAIAASALMFEPLPAVLRKDQRWQDENIHYCVKTPVISRIGQTLLVEPQEDDFCAAHCFRSFAVKRMKSFPRIIAFHCLPWREVETRIANGKETTIHVYDSDLANHTLSAWSLRKVRVLRLISCNISSN